MESRRSFLKSGVMTALSMGLVAGAGRMIFGQQQGSTQGAEVAIPNEARQETLFHYNQAAFESYLGSTFTTVGATGRTAELILESVTSYTTNPKVRITTAAPKESECFTLSFNASESLPIFTSIHTLHHDALGDIQLFLVERKTESGALFYDAVINHSGAAPSIKRTRPVLHKDDSPRMAAPDAEPEVYRPGSGRTKS